MSAEARRAIFLTVSRTAGRWSRGLFALLLVLAAPLCATSCIIGGPQIVSISPGRGASNVPSTAPIQITFDRPVDRGSVASRFRLYPMKDGRPLTSDAVGGRVEWEGERTAVFRHRALRAGTYYQVVLEPGYRDTSGSANGITHSWVFKTEPPPTLTGSSPGAGDTGVDPLADVSLDFSRPMNLASLAQAVSIDPSLPFHVVADPADPRRALVAPAGLLSPRTTYTVTVSASGRDVDGNRLGQPSRLRFTTGGLRPLTGLVTVSAGAAGRPRSSGVWVVDGQGIPRRIVETPALSFRWADDGLHLLLQTGPRTWASAVAGGGASPLPFQADWAAPLPGSGGYLARDGANLERISPGGDVTVLASGVQAAALGPDGERVAFTAQSGAVTQIRALDLRLSAQYLLTTEPGAVADPAWSPDGTRIAYRTQPPGQSQWTIRVMTLSPGAGAGPDTVASGQVGPPVWMPDSRRIVVSAVVPDGLGGGPKLFILAPGGAPSPLSIAGGLPSGGLAASSPSPSPDGHQVAFLAPVQGALQAFWMNADGTGVTQLTGGGSWFPYSCLALTWNLP